MVKVSVVIPAYNAEEFLQDALDSVLNQTLKSFEVIVVDDGSSDGTPDILRQYGNHIKWRSQDNRGQASAINEGVRLSTAEYIAYLDADDMCLPERLEVEVRYLDEHPDEDLVYSDHYYTDKFGEIQETAKSRPLDRFLLLQYNHIARSSVMHRKVCLDKVGLFDESNTGNDDWDMWVKMSEVFRLAHINIPLVKRRIHGRNISYTRPKRLNYYRWTRMRMLEQTYVRRGRPFWLKLMLVRAKLEWIIGRTPLLGERFPGVWGRVGKVLDLMERVVIVKMPIRISKLLAKPGRGSL